MYGLSREVAAVRKDSNSEWREVGGVLRGERREKRRRVVPGGKGVAKRPETRVPAQNVRGEIRRRMVPAAKAWKKPCVRSPRGKGVGKNWRRVARRRMRGRKNGRVGARQHVCW